MSNERIKVSMIQTMHEFKRVNDSERISVSMIQTMTEFQRLNERISVTINQEM